ncbi:MAG: hypothetical protein IPL08_17835 [Saprospiraceae bacterium]|nr:hypothetical protein [Saprospiraceae bacterium]
MTGVSRFNRKKPSLKLEYLSAYEYTALGYTAGTGHYLIVLLFLHCNQSDRLDVYFCI